MLRASLDNALRERGIFDAAREVLRTYAQCAIGGAAPPISAGALPADVFEALRAAGLVDRLLAAAREEGLSLDAAAFELLCGGGGSGGEGQGSLAAGGATAGPSPSPLGGEGPARAPPTAAASAAQREVEAEHLEAQQQAALDPSRRYLRLELGRGRAFLAHLDATYAGVGIDEEEEEERGEGGQDSAEAAAGGGLPRRAATGAAAAAAAAPLTRRYYTLHLLVNGARFRSLPVPAVVEPAFGASGSGVFYVDVQPPHLASLAPLAALLAAGEAPPHEAAAAPTGDAYACIHVVCTLTTHRLPPALAAPSFSSDSTTAAGAGAGAAAPPPLLQHDSVRSEIIGSAQLDWRGVCCEESGELTALLPLLPPSSSPGTVLPSSSAGEVEGEEAGSSINSSSIGGSSSVAIGLLPITLRLCPSTAATAAALSGAASTPTTLPSRAALSRLTHRRALKAQDAYRAFLTYARAWWHEYKALHPTFKRRLVRIFGEGGEADTQYVPLPTRLAALVPGRDTLLHSPRAAARFVSLLPSWAGEPVAAVGQGAPGAPAWRALHAILATRGGTAADHALLLCSLFLGFGLDAFVCVGTSAAAAAAGTAGGSALGLGSSSSLGDSGGGALLGAIEEETAWVLTRVPSAEAVGGYACTFHDPLTGLAFSPTSSASPYLRMACAFSATAFFASTSGDDTVAAIAARHGWGFEDPLGSAWKGMEEALLASLPHTPAPPLSPPTMSAPAVAAALEEALKEAWEAWRASPAVADRCSVTRRALAQVSGRAELDAPCGSELQRSSGGASAGAPLPLAVAANATPWSQRFSFLMSQALTAYETDRLNGRVSGSSGGGSSGSDSSDAMANFSVAIKRLVPRGSAYRAFPIAFNHVSPSRAWCTLLASPAAREILETPCHADPALTRFSLRVQVTPYPEDTVAAWVMLGVCTHVPTRA